jgi:hypothetical protein
MVTFSDSFMMSLMIKRLRTFSLRLVALEWMGVFLSLHALVVLLLAENKCSGVVVKAML